jgi:hypothetical protein
MQYLEHARGVPYAAPAEVMRELKVLMTCDDVIRIIKVEFVLHHLRLY